MTTTADRQLNQIKAALQRWFDRSVTRRQAGAVLAELMGPVSGMRGLSVVAEDMMVSHRLASQGGSWETVSILDAPGPIARSLYGDGLTGLKEGALPYPDQSFDVLLLENVLEYFADDAAFINECHRVLKPAGYLILKVPVLKRFSLLLTVRRWLGLGGWEQGRARQGYSEAALFEVLKNGFDTEEVRHWSRFFTELVETKIQTLLAITGATTTDAGQVGDEERTLMGYRRVARVYGLCYPFALLARVLDGLLFFTRGYSMAVRARHRAWKPRHSPSLKDGRSIADAAINTKIGTAAPF